MFLFYGRKCHYCCLIVSIRDIRNILIFKIWWNFENCLFTIKNIAEVYNIYSLVGKFNIGKCSILIVKRSTFYMFENVVFYLTMSYIMLGNTGGRSFVLPSAAKRDPFLIGYPFLTTK